MLNFKQIFNGLRLKAKAALNSDTKGELEVLESDGKLYYHDGTTRTPLLTTTSTAVITNKDLVDASVNIVDSIDNTKKISFDAAGTTGTATTIVSSQTTNKTLTLPDATDTLVGKATTDTLTNKTIDANGTGNSISNLETADLATGVLNVSTTLATASDTQVPSALAVKTYVDNKAAAQNEASELTFTPAGTIVATNLQAAVEEVSGDVTDHLGDITDAHDASAISSVASGNLSATDVQSALNELQSDIDTRASGSGLSDHLSDTVDAHDASAISNVPSGNLAATDVQAALNELQSDIDTRSLTTGGSIITPTRSDVKQDTLANLTTYASTATDGQLVFATDTEDFYGVVNNALVPVGGGGVATSAVDNLFTINDAVDPTKQIDFDAAGTTGTKTTLLSSQTTNKVLTLPNATDTLVGKNTTDILTNKSIDGTTNTLTNVTATTNANLTGPITSVGNATSVAAQTGTGSTFVMNTSPTLVMPNIGVATGTSLAVGGTLNANSVLDVQSTVKGMMPPRMTTAQKLTLGSSLTTTDEGMIVYDTDINALSSWNGTQWIASIGSLVLDNLYSAKISSAGVISDEAPDFISSCTASAGKTTCQFTTGRFTVIPNCWAITRTTSGGTISETVYMDTSNYSTTEVAFKQVESGAASSDGATLFCAKTGADYVSSTFFTAASANYDWTSYTPTITGLGTVSPSTNFCKHRRMGGDLEVMCSVTSGTVAASLFSATLPNSLTIDAARLTAANTTANPGQKIGTWSTKDASVFGEVVTATGTSTSLVYWGSNASQSTRLTPNNGNVSGSSSLHSINFKVPISGWSNLSQVMANLSNYTQPSNSIYKTSAGQSIPNATSTIVNFGTVESDTDSFVTTGASWKYLPTVAGYYEVSSAIQFASNNYGSSVIFEADLYKNGTVVGGLGYFQNSATGVNVTPNLLGTRQVYLNGVTDYLDIRAYQNSGGAQPLASGAQYNYISIKRTGN